MTRILFGLVLLSISPLGAQTVRGSFAAGLFMQEQDSFGDDTGWHVLGSLQFGVARFRFSVRLDGIHGETKYPGGSLSSTLTGGTVSLVYRLARSGNAQVYLLAGPGLSHAWFAERGDIASHSGTQVAVGGGAGASVGARAVRFFTEWRYLDVLNNRWFGSPGSHLLAAGVSLGS